MDIDRAMRNPASTFVAPEAVSASGELTAEQKHAVLLQWKDQLQQRSNCKPRTTRACDKTMQPRAGRMTVNVHPKLISRPPEPGQYCTPVYTLRSEIPREPRRYVTAGARSVDS